MWTRQRDLRVVEYNDRKAGRDTHKVLRRGARYFLSDHTLSTSSSSTVLVDGDLDLGGLEEDGEDVGEGFHRNAGAVRTFERGRVERGVGLVDYSSGGRLLICWNCYKKCRIRMLRRAKSCARREASLWP